MAALTCSLNDGNAMSTTHESRASLSAEAYDLIQCLYDGVDIFVRDLAEEIAAERGSFLEDKKTIAIETEDVREAGKRVIAALKELIKDRKLPEQLEESLHNMQGCFNHNAD